MCWLASTHRLQSDSFDVYLADAAIQTTSGQTIPILTGEAASVTNFTPSNWDGQQFAYRAWDGSTFFQHKSPIGTDRVRTNYQGQVATIETSLPFGESYGTSTSDPYGANQDNDEYAGLEHDQESYTEHATFRQYSSTQGRWMSPDPYLASYMPWDPQSMNRYAYALNNPFVFADPSGLFCEYASDTFDEDGSLDEVDYNSSSDECSSTGGMWFPDGDSWTYRDNGDITSVSLGSYLANGPSWQAPSNAIPWYKNPCVQRALAKGTASTAIDAVGLLPEGGAVAGAFSLWHGAAGVSNGIKILQRVKFGVGIISTANAGSDASQDGALSLAGAQLATGFASIGAGLAKATPIVGQVLSGISVAEDLYGTYKAVAGCHP